MEQPVLAGSPVLDILAFGLRLRSDAGLVSIVDQERASGMAEATSEPTASFLDRLVARSDLMTFGVPAVPVMLTSAVVPSLIALVQLVSSRPSLTPLLIIMLLPVLWLGLWLAREIRSWLRPVASTRWLRAALAVVGDEAMTRVVAHARGMGADHLTTYRDVVDEFWGTRIQGWKAAWRARGVQPDANERAS